MNKLLPYQVPHVYQLYESIQINKCVLDASDTGTGKTYTSIMLSKLLNLRPFIISPKSVLSNWVDVCEKLDVKLFGLANYELLKNCKYYTENLECVNCPYMDVIDNIKDKEIVVPGKNKLNKKSNKKLAINVKKDFVFQLPDNVLIILDEAHRCKNHKTITSNLLLSISKTNNKIVLLSATICDKINCFMPFGVVFGFYDNKKQFNLWMNRQIKSRKIEYKNLNLNDDHLKLKIIHESIFPSKGSRMKIKELGDLFPKNQVIAKCYFMDNHEEVNKLYQELNCALEDLKDKEKRASALGQIIRIRQRLELIRVPIFLDLTNQALDNGYSVVIFVNYRATMDYLCHHLKCDCTINGDQNLEERDMCIKEFQTNQKKLIIATIQSGGVGISLQDLDGNHPRLSLISPTWSAQDLTQSLGRIHRATSKTPALQRIIYIAKSYEEKICQLIEKKLINLSGINDGDLVGPNIPIEQVKLVNDLTEKKNP